ncbi:MAG: hypothetical protein ACLR23_23875 [Clostridia bacterium]
MRQSVRPYFAILGVTYYLTLPIFEQTIEKISQLSCQGNQMVFDFPDETTFAAGGGGVHRVRQLTEITARLGNRCSTAFPLRKPGRHFCGTALSWIAMRHQKRYSNIFLPAGPTSRGLLKISILFWQ